MQQSPLQIWRNQKELVVPLVEFYYCCYYGYYNERPKNSAPNTSKDNATGVRIRKELKRICTTITCGNGTDGENAARHVDGPRSY